MRQPGTHSDRPLLIIGSLWLLVFAVSSQSMIVAPILPRIADQTGVPEARLAPLITGYAAAVAVVAVIAGPLSDRLGRRRMLLAGGSLMAVSLAFHGFATGFGTLLVARILAGASGGALTGATVAYVGDYFPAERRGWANGWIGSGAAVGEVLGIPTAVLLAAAAGFEMPFLLYAAIMGLSVALLYWFLPQPDVETVDRPLDLRRLLGAYAAVFAKSQARAAVAIYFLTSLSVSLYLLYLPTWLERSEGAAPRQVAVLFGVGGVATILAGPAAGMLSDRTGRKRIVATASAGVAIAMVLTPRLVVDLSAAYATFFVAMALSAARWSPLQALMPELTPETERGSLMSISMAAGQVGSGLGAIIAAASYAAFGYPSNSALGAAASLLVLVLVARYLPESSRAGRHAR